MILAIDIGNTNIALGAYEKGKLAFCTRISTDRALEASQYAMELKGLMGLYGVDAKEIDGAIISSVVPQVTAKVSEAVSMVTNIQPIVFSQSLPIGIDIKIDNPAELGADLVAGALGAIHSYPLPAVVIDMGTATKLTVIDKSGAVLGVSIMPGVFLSFNALLSTASLLGAVALEAPRHVVGKNTRDSLQSGIVLGTASMLDGMLDRIESETGEIKSVVSTGGASSFVTLHCRHRIENVPTLILDGLVTAYNILKK